MREFLEFDFDPPVLSLFYEGTGKGGKERLEVKIDLEEGTIDGPLRRLSPENSVAVLKLLVQGRVSALVRMIGNSLEKERKDGRR